MTNAKAEATTFAIIQIRSGNIQYLGENELRAAEKLISGTLHGSGPNEIEAIRAAQNARWEYLAKNKPRQRRA